MSFSLLQARFRFVLVLVAVSCLFSLTVCATDQKPAQEYYQLKIYHFTTAEQEGIIDNYLKTAYLPALHKAGFKNVGVFKLIANDTLADKRLYVFFSASSLDKLTALPQTLQKDGAYNAAAKNYHDAEYNHPAFARIETVLMKAFPLAPAMQLPALKGDKKDRVYELRSYEGASEKLYNKKVEMFNAGGEISLFKRLQFNAVFYAEVLSGARMPNLMYLTTFENMPERTKHWSDFFGDPEWKRISALPEYQHVVSKADIMLARPTEYSDF